MARRCALGLAALLTACAMPPAGHGSWAGTFGGQHIRMIVGTAGAEIEYDCAAGQLVGPLPVRGSFVIAGSHTPGTGGPERAGEARPAYPASYQGRVSGDLIEMVVVADLPAGRTRLGPFRLRRGSDGVLFRCL